MEQQQSGPRIGRRAFRGILHDQGLISWTEELRRRGPVSHVPDRDKKAVDVSVHTAPV